ncbi:MAG: autotransporter domain-containing protein [Candidatus Poseidoniia archaeon]|nr:autotransporter domain-containing protein [Candidatus Poseidoniia archaeon]
MKLLALLGLTLSLFILNISTSLAATHTVNISCNGTTGGFDLDGNGSFEVRVNTRSKTIAAGDTLNINYYECDQSFSSAYSGQEAAHSTEFCGSFSPTPPTGTGLSSPISFVYSAGMTPYGGKTTDYCDDESGDHGDHVQYLSSASGTLSPQLTIVVTGMTADDITNPTLQSSSPSDNATGVTVGSNIVLTFDEAVDVETGNITIKKTSDDSTVETIDVTGGLVTGTGTTTITVNPTSNLAGNTEYYILIDATAFDDPSSNSYAGIASTTALSFTTADIAAPSLSSSTPTDDATGVTVGSNIVLTFDEAVDVETGNITIKKTSDDSTVETIDVTSGLVTGTGTSAITINPTADLAEGTEYYVLIDATAFDDTSANSYAGISSTTALSFTTISTALPNPFDDSEVVNLIQAQTSSVINIANQAITPVNNRLSRLLSAPRDSLANNSHQGIQLSLNSDSNLNSLISQSGLLSGLNSSGDIFDNGWAIWTEGSVVLGKRNGGSDFQVDGITVGVDKRITPSLTTGLAFRMAQEDDDIGSTTSIDTDSYSATAYGSYAVTNDSFIQAALGYSDVDISSKRLSNTSEVTGDRNADQVYISLSLTHRYDYMGFTLLPYGSFDSSYSTLDTYSETGSNLALTYHDQTVTTLSAKLGLRGSYFIEESYGLFVPRFHVNYQGDIKSDSDAKVSYISTPSTTYSQSYDANASSSWLLGLGLNYHYENLTFSADYERTEQVNWGNSDTFRLMLNATF